MGAGAKYEFYVPSDLAYAARSTCEVNSHSMLIFEVELLEIIKIDNPVKSRYGQLSTVNKKPNTLPCSV
jgi:hypothetical protein